MGAINQTLQIKIESYYVVQGLDGKYYIAKGYPSGPIVKDGLTHEEAQTYMRLLKEQ